MSEKTSIYTSIVTGDIINSRKYQSSEWLVTLKNALERYGKKPLQWEIYRGDSFQVEVQLKRALEAALYIKACIKQYKSLDVRMAIGIGEKNQGAIKITEANGSAFVNSGECFEHLGKNTLAIRSPWPEVDKEINLYLTLALLTINNWSSNASGIIKTAMEFPTLTQKELAKKLNKTQSTISESLSRTGYEEVMLLEERYREILTNK